MSLIEILGQVFGSSTSTSGEGSLPQNAWSNGVGASSFDHGNIFPIFPMLLHLFVTEAKQKYEKTTRHKNCRLITYLEKGNTK